MCILFISPQAKETQQRRAEDQANEDAYESQPRNQQCDVAGEDGHDPSGMHEDDDIDETNNEQQIQFAIPTGPPIVTLRGVSQSLTTSRRQQLKVFIQQQQLAAMDKYKQRNECCSTTAAGSMSTRSSSGYISNEKYPDHELMTQQYAAGLATCGDDQRKTLNDIVRRIAKDPAVDESNQLIAFLSGEGGTGKTHIIKLLRIKANLLFGKTDGTYGPLVPLGPTGSAANTNDGFTWQSILHAIKAPNTDGNINQASAVTLSKRYVYYNASFHVSMLLIILFCII